ncbi:class I SAM-dependent methyltransferase [Tateyamaria armeniaca]|uniref:Class I SAM-dependent methyltransferase n=1 Tax=Tateyamaria armeniaca TaxID=2518930 RepID=A0ABW8UTX6_9RHOB
MQHPKKRLAKMDRLERVLVADIAAMAKALDAPARGRKPAKLSRKWRAIEVSHSALRTLVKDILNETSDPRIVSPGGRRAIRDLNSAAKTLKNQMRDWAQINRLVELQIHPASVDLFADTVPTAPPSDVMGHVSALFIDALHTVANPKADTQSADAQDAGLHRDIALPISQFSAMLGAAYRICLAQRKTHALRFLDVGCGGGTKVLAATTCFETCDGLEYEEGTVALGTKLLDILGADRCRLIHGDAFTFSDYASYDTLYFYRPMKSTEDMIALEARVLDQAEPGTVLMVPGGLLTPDLEGAGVQHVSGHIYVTGISQPEAETLHDAARVIGTSIPGHAQDVSSEPGIWEPLLDVCARNGYRI